MLRTIDVPPDARPVELAKMYDLPIVETRYDNDICVNTDCRHCPGLVIETIVIDRDRYWNSYIAVRKYYGCDKSHALGRYRWSVFQRAQREKDAAYDRAKERGVKTLDRLLKVQREAWESVTPDWYNLQCPFYEAGE